MLVVYFRQEIPDFNLQLSNFTVEIMWSWRMRDSIEEIEGVILEIASGKVSEWNVAEICMEDSWVAQIWLGAFFFFDVTINGSVSETTVNTSRETKVWVFKKEGLRYNHSQTSGTNV